jgi:hypothetical protein
MSILYNYKYRVEKLTISERSEPISEWKIISLSIDNEKTAVSLANDITIKEQVPTRVIFGTEIIWESLLK